MTITPTERHTMTAQNPTPNDTMLAAYKALDPRQADKAITVPTHATDGTQVTFYIDVLGLAALAEAVTRADLNEQSVTLMAEIEPEHTQTATLKVKIGQGTWSRGIGTVLVKRAHMYDNTLLDG